MKKVHRLFLAAMLAFAGISLVSVVRAKDSTPPVQTEDGQAAGTVIVPDGLKASDVQRSILEAATNRGWTIKAKDDGKVTIVLENGRWLALLNLVYDAKEVQIYSKSTKSGKPAVPEDWVKYIKQDITKALNTKAFLK